MFSQPYHKVRDELSRTIYKLKETQREAEKLQKKTFEDNEVEKILENAIEEIENIESQLEYLSKPAKFGKLAEDSSGKFYIKYDDGSESHLLSCGSSLELYYDDLQEWQIGRVEARDGQYYFYGDDRPFLHRGMRVRKRG